ncbi:MAG: hypothetical protein WAZ14_00980 [Patescibacteria group bacterium]
MANNSHVSVCWGSPDDRGLVGQLEGGGRKLVRLDNKAKIPADMRPEPNTVQPCRVSHDTAPDAPGRGVMFVVPIGPAVDQKTARERRMAQNLSEVRAEWKAAWRRAVVSDLTNLVSGYKANIGYDTRWNVGRENLEPQNPLLRVVDDQAGVWTKPCQNGVYIWEECVLVLPELGQGEELSKRLLAAWRQSSSLNVGLERLTDLGLSLTGPIDRTVTVNVQNYVIVNWSGVVNGERITIAERWFKPGDGETGDEDIPEVATALAVWCKKVVDDCSRDESWDTLVSGVVTLSSHVTPTFEYLSPDERGTRTGGGNSINVVHVDGQKVGNVSALFWPEAQAFFGLVEGGHHPGLSARQLRAFNLALSDWTTSGRLGPRGRAAMLAEAGVNYDPAAVMAAGKTDKARRDFEAEAQKVATQAAEAAALKIAAAEISNAAKTVMAAKHFRCFAPTLQALLTSLVSEANRPFVEDYWLSWAQRVMLQIQEATPAAIAAAGQEEQGEILANFQAWKKRSGGPTNNGQGWVIQPDGSCREPDRMDKPRPRHDEGTQHWDLVSGPELAISWSRAHSGAPHEFAVAKMPTRDRITKAQRATVVRLQTEIAEAGGDCGNCWGLTPVIAAPALAPRVTAPASPSPEVAKAKVSAADVEKLREALGIKRR